MELSYNINSLLRKAQESKPNLTKEERIGLAQLKKFYGLPKIHKTGTPLRPIVSSRGLATYGVTKVLSKVLKLWVGKSPIMYKVPVTL